MIAESGRGSRNPIDIAFRRGVTETGYIFSPAGSGRLSSMPSIFGTSGPCISASIKPTSKPAMPRANARFAATVVLPTPPFPLITIILCFTLSMLAFTAASSSSIRFFFSSSTILFPLICKQIKISPVVSFHVSYPTHRVTLSGLAKAQESQDLSLLLHNCRLLSL